MENIDFDNLTEIDLSSLDWDCMTPDEFIKAEKQAQKILKDRKKQRSIGKKENIVKIYGNNYQIKYKDYMMYKRATTIEQIDKIRGKIVAEYTPIIEL